MVLRWKAVERCPCITADAGKPPRSFKVRRRRESSSSGDSTVGSAEDHSRAFVDSPGVSSHSYPEDESMQVLVPDLLRVSMALQPFDSREVDKSCSCI